jgi:tRNA modification GTPase
MTFYYQDTITAIATAAGRGGVGIVRISGPQALSIAEKILGFTPKNRFAHYCDFNDYEKRRLDQGIALYFNNPHSFTGEDVVELQAHGGPVILDLLLKTILQYGGRLAEPGEFSQRAFFNDKLDLVQAEAISDLINSTSEQAARCAIRSLQGEFSKQINDILDQLIKLRIFVEAAIDFPEEEVDFLTESNVLSQIDTLIETLNVLFKNANQGALLTEGMRVVIAGKPNAGKSSLLNALAGKNSAIVTDIEGTTRDVLKEEINIDGMPLHIIDTAGLRESSDEVEKIGIDRAWKEIEQADRILLVTDASDSKGLNTDDHWEEFVQKLERTDHLSLVRNKVDKLNEEASLNLEGPYPVISISAKTKHGLNFLQEHLKDCVGFNASNEGSFTARRRHLEALTKAIDAVKVGRKQLTEMNAGELLAEELRIAQDALSEITGKFTPDDLLGEIFSSFCIGK